MARNSGRHGRRKVSVPNVTGSSRSNARTAITSASLTYSESSTATSDSGLSEIVQGQGISSGSVILIGSDVPFTYYNYVAPPPPIIATPPPIIAVTPPIIAVTPPIIAVTPPPPPIIAVTPPIIAVTPPIIAVTPPIIAVTPPPPSCTCDPFGNCPDPANGSCCVSCGCICVGSTKRCTGC